MLMLRLLKLLLILIIIIIKGHVCKIYVATSGEFTDYNKLNPPPQQFSIRSQCV